MNEQQLWAQQFEENRSHLRAVAYRMLGSASEADDAVQEAWLRLNRSNAAVIENLGGWLTTVVARVCLDMLRSRASRREEPLEPQEYKPAAERGPARDPEQEALVADSVGLALLVILERLTPAERIAFVLHDTFDISFDEIAPIVGRTPAATRQLASRARRRVHATGTQGPAELNQQKDVVDAFVAALRAGDIEGLITVLHPEVVVRIDEAAGRPGTPREIHGARAWAQGAVAYRGFFRSVAPMLLDGAPGLVFAPHGRVTRALRFTIAGGQIAEVEIIADPARLRDMDVRVLQSGG